MVRDLHDDERLRLRRCAAADLRDLRDDPRLLHCTTNCATMNDLNDELSDLYDLKPAAASKNIEFIVDSATAV